MHQGEDSSATAATEFEGSARDSGNSESMAPGTRLGAYKIRRPLGEGGMGQVYLAEQTAPVHRDVALKLIRQQIASPLALAWFEVERQALAQMQHPAIAQIFDAGTTDEGHAYIAMEYVEGVPLTEFSRTNGLTRDQRIALFVRICQGVQHAHQKGVIHRDLKPDNVLVQAIDGIPMPKIIDFGIAIGGSVSDSGPVVSRNTSDHAGTAIYMSPEQAGSKHRDIDTRTDVYALGVMLCELLTHSDARALTSDAHHSTHAPHQTLLTALAGEAEAPSATPSAHALLNAARTLPAELRAILRKALALDRADRYESAAALGQDLERYREHRPLSAMPASRAYAARKFIARHRLGILATGVAALALIAGTIMAVQGQRRAEVAAELARIEADKAAQVAAFVQEMIAGIDPDRAKGLDRSLMRLMLDSAASRAGTELGDQPAVRSTIESTIARSYAAIGEYALAAEHFSAARTAAISAGSPKAERARLLLAEADADGNLGHFEQSRVLASQALEEVRDLPETDRDRLYIESRLAWHEQGAGQFETSIKRYQRVLALQQAAFGIDDDDTLETQRGMGANYARVDRYAEAEPLFKFVLERYTQRYGPTHTKTLDLTTGLGVTYLEQEKYAEAEALLRPALELTESRLGPEHPNTMVLVSNLGSAIRKQDRNEEARPYYERVLATNLKINGPDHYLSVAGESNLALLLRDAGDIAGAEKHARLSIAHLQNAFPPEHPARAIFIAALGSVLVSAGKYAEAETHFDAAYAIFLGAPGFGPRHSRTLELIENYIKLYGAWGKPEEKARWQETLDKAKRAEEESTATRG
ncbi:tetratricopeptide repeat protein [Dokdonella sp.]|uniref:tetratricopeptide repeat protein n=1 Tax=Dokdonella sp. TaxID=2291710 RepID=UPI0035274D62